ncbi:MAG: hypothetical protein LAO04_10590 [Acidobacteriia bacterium]|nr:hypothetical protein [Terriglobia bacterium]
MRSILLVVFQTLTRAEVKRFRAPREPVGKLRGNKHAADGVARRLATLGTRGLGWV